MTVALGTTRFAEVPIKRLFRIVNGGTPPSDDRFWGGEVVWVTPADLAALDGGSVRQSLRTLTREGLVTGSVLVPAGALVLSTRAPIGYVVRSEVPLATNQGCKSLVPGADQDIRYVQYVLSAARATLQASGNGTTFMELSGSALGQIRIPVPTQAEQQRIADYLDAETQRIDDLVAEQIHQIDLLWERRRAAVFDSVTGRSESGPRQAGVPWTDDVPKAWRLAKLTSVAQLGSGHTPSRSRPELWTDPSIPWITTGEVQQIRSDEQEILIQTREMISVAGVANSAAAVHSAGTVVLCRTAASAGYSAVMGTDMATSQDFATWTCGPELDPFFLLYCLRAMRHDLLGRLAMGSTHRTIYMPDIKGLIIPLPSRPEQARVIDDLRKELALLDETRREFHSQIALLRERRQALITHAVTHGIEGLPGVA